MSWSYEASVVNHNGIDYWRTWFLEECEDAGLFGVNQKHLPLLMKSGLGFNSYRVGTKIYLEDAPYFKKTQNVHRVCGPYSIVPIKLPPGGIVTYTVEGSIIIYKEPRPNEGPWVDRSRVTRTIEGLKIIFPQKASQFGFYPYRFAIQKSSNFKIQLVDHDNNDCWLCVGKRGRRVRRG